MWASKWPGREVVMLGYEAYTVALTKREVWLAGISMKSEVPGRTGDSFVSF